MNENKREERIEKMLNLIKERLDVYTVEETVDRLHSYEGSGPTIREFFEDLNPKKKINEMIVYPVNLTVEESEKLSEFHETMKGYRDYSRFFKHMIMKVIYNDSWTTHEEENGLAIFETYDNSLYYINYGHCVMLPDVVEFNPVQITKEVAEQMISEMVKEISDNQTNFTTHK